MFLFFIFTSGPHICFTIEFNKTFFVLKGHSERAQKQTKNKPKTEETRRARGITAGIMHYYQFDKNTSFLYLSSLVRCLLAPITQYY